MKQREYVEGPEALENFERMATALFKIPQKRGSRRINPKCLYLFFFSEPRGAESLWTGVWTGPDVSPILGPRRLPSDAREARVRRALDLSLGVGRGARI
jgi:hypothetical protein